MAEPMMALVAALSRNHVIGKDNQLLWRLPADMAHFKELTSGHAVIMGRKTYLSLPEKFRPLPNRLNVVLSRQPQTDSSQDRLLWTAEFKRARETAAHDAAERGQDQYFVIGGGEIYAQALPFAQRLYLTHIDADYEGDAFFPTDYQTMQWQKTILAEHPAQNGQPGFTIVQYDKADCT